MARMKIIDEELADNIMYSCSSAGLLYSCAELLRVAPNPRTHPFMEILEVWIQLTCVCVRARVRVCVCVCVSARARARVCVCVCV